MVTDFDDVDQSTHDLARSDSEDGAKKYEIDGIIHWTSNSIYKKTKPTKYYHHMVGDDVVGEKEGFDRAM